MKLLLLIFYGHFPNVLRLTVSITPYVCEIKIIELLHLQIFYKITKRIHFIYLIGLRLVANFIR